jgi:hypothetical protein
VTGVPKEANCRLDQPADNGRQAQGQADLGVVEPEITPDERPGSFTCAENQLVEQLDEEERQQEL